MLRKQGARALRSKGRAYAMLSARAWTGFGSKDRAPNHIVACPRRGALCDIVPRRGRRKGANEATEEGSAEPGRGIGNMLCHIT